jgi:hypothetical protein
VIELISIGDQLRDGQYELHSRFMRAANFRYGDAMAAVVDEDIGAGPLNIVIKRTEIRNILSLKIQDRILYLNRRQYSFSSCSLYDSQIGFLGNIHYEKFLTNLAIFKNCLIAHSSERSLVFLLESDMIIRRGTACRAPTDCKETNPIVLINNIDNVMYPKSAFEQELRNRIQLGVNTIESGNILDGVRMIQGLGYGLTPSGDDFIAGMICALWLAGPLLGRNYHELISRIYYTAVGGNFLSNAFLRCAKEGRFLLKQKGLVEAILYGNEHDVVNWTKKMLTIGETSGADWGTGFVMTLARANELL